MTSPHVVETRRAGATPTPAAVRAVRTSTGARVAMLDAGAVRASFSSLPVHGPHLPSVSEAPDAYVDAGAPGWAWADGWWPTIERVWLGEDGQVWRGPASPADSPWGGGGR